MDKNCKNLYSKLKIFDWRFLMEGAELIDTTSNSMDRLLQYLDTNLTTLHDNLNEDNFERILFVIWDILSESLYQLVHNNLEVRLRETYNILSLFVFSNFFQTISIVNRKGDHHRSTRTFIAHCTPLFDTLISEPTRQQMLKCWRRSSTFWSFMASRQPSWYIVITRSG